MPDRATADRTGVRLEPRTLWLVALACVVSGCVSTRAVPRPFPTPGPRPPNAPPKPAVAPPPASGAPTADRLAPPEPGLDTAALVGTALTFRGVPYRNGGADPSGFDCSGFTQYVYRRYGIVLPREVRDQFDLGTPVGTEAIAPGDLLFFTTVAPGASHVAIALGGDEFVHAPSSTGVVRVERTTSAYWAARFVAARRVGPQSLKPAAAN